MHRRPARTHTKPARRVWLWLAGFLLLLSVTFAWRQYSTSLFVSRNWRVNVLLNSNPLTVISFPNESSDKLVIVTVPESAYVRVPWGYGEYRVGALVKLAEQENKPDLFAESISDLFGLKLHGVWSRNEAVTVSEEALLDDIKKEVSFSYVTSQTPGQLNLLDRSLVYWKLKNWSHRDVKVLSTHTTDQLYHSQELPDGTDIKVADSEQLTRFFERTFEEAAVRSESLSIAVHNTTEVSGVGQQFARFISTLGGDVIALGNEAEDVSNCIVELTEAHKNATLVKFLKSEFECELAYVESVEGADIKIKVGTYFATRWER